MSEKKFICLSLSDYEPAYTSALYVWTNPPIEIFRDILDTWTVLNMIVSSESASMMLLEQIRGLDQDLIRLMAQIWAWDENGKLMTVEEVQEINNELTDCDPNAWRWLFRNTVQLLTDETIERIKELDKQILRKLQEGR